MFFKARMTPFAFSLACEANSKNGTTVFSVRLKSFVFYLILLRAVLYLGVAPNAAVQSRVVTSYSKRVD